MSEELGFWRSRVFSTDHKVIAKQYLSLGLFWALMGGATAYLIRWQIAHPDTEAPGWGFIAPDFYNMLVTMHGTIMVFFVAMPILLAAFGNFLIPLMIGAKDMAFPRLNMLSFWVFFLASVVLMASFFVPGGAAAAGWTGYPPLSAKMEYTGVGWGMNLWLLALALEFASFLLGGVNFLTTAMNMRAPGLTWFRLPVIVWMQLTAAVIFMLSVGPLIAGAVMLLMDRLIGTTFFLPEGGGEPLLWQHLFWFFGHPEVYVILLPGLGIVVDVISVFSRKPVFAYRPIIYSTIVAGFMSFIVWAHHQFISGIDPRLAMPFSITTIIISVPFAFVIFSIIATLWRASITFSAAMLFALGSLGVFIFGGLTGIFNGSAPVDIYIHDTYFVVAHFHYTLFSVVFFGSFAGLYFWFPKMFGRMMNEALGKIHFWLTFIFFNAVFIPMHLVGLRGMMRRIANPMQYEFLKPLEPLNMFITLSAILLLVSQVVFVINFFMSLARGKAAERNPWQANTLEWTTDSPPPHGNFAAVPSVYRGPYEYSSPESAEDWLPQDRPLTASRTAVR
ncbi:MAG: cbb3-type cytochrome c oxidase subunit I [Deltaproteobacteria bacterium]|nr:cbb3-type cytochrome c oxidase subunit I [Deltaproteobacteria bacterium]MBI2228162.1 cbb3-type cytochrome c oxidase subunit I [Deltaproteobacteria bacterium]MBI3064857.1 cbb3-type cytochrome c oxidase subunit I [Deltaproteobacteria bacterium]